AKLRRKITGYDAVAFRILQHLNPKKVIERRNYKIFDRLGIADCLIHLPKVSLDLFGLNRVLGENAARGLFPFGGLLDFASDIGLGLGSFVKFVEVKLDLSFVPPLGNLTVGVEKQSLGNRIDDALRVFGEGNINPCSALDLAHFAQENIKDDAIDGIIGSVEEAGFYFRSHLPK